MAFFPVGGGIKCLGEKGVNQDAMLKFCNCGTQAAVL